MTIKIFSPTQRKVFIKGLSQHTSPFGYMGGEIYRDAKFIDRFFKTGNRLDVEKIMARNANAIDQKEKDWFNFANLIYQKVYKKPLETLFDLKRFCMGRFAEYKNGIKRTFVKERDGLYNGKDVIFGIPIRRSNSQFLYIKPYTLEGVTAKESERFAASKAGLSRVENKPDKGLYYSMQTDETGKATAKDTFKWDPANSVFVRIGHKELT